MPFAVRYAPSMPCATPPGRNTDEGWPRGASRLPAQELTGHGPTPTGVHITIPSPGLDPHHLPPWRRDPTTWSAMRRRPSSAPRQSCHGSPTIPEREVRKGRPAPAGLHPNAWCKPPKPTCGAWSRQAGAPQMPPGCWGATTTGGPGRLTQICIPLIWAYLSFLRRRTAESQQRRHEHCRPPGGCPALTAALNFTPDLPVAKPAPRTGRCRGNGIHRRSLPVPRGVEPGGWYRFRRRDRWRGAASPTTPGTMGGNDWRPPTTTSAHCSTAMKVAACTRHQARRQDHYLVATAAAADFIQVEIEELQEFTSHALFVGEVPGSLEELVDPAPATRFR